MQHLTEALVGLIALAHVGFMVLEALLWRSPVGRKIFSMSPEQAEATAVLAANQGVYNGFLAAGLFWSLMPQSPAPFALRVFFLGCVLVAGVVGAVTASRAILWIQAAPALVALIMTWLTRA